MQSPRYRIQRDSFGSLSYEDKLDQARHWLPEGYYGVLLSQPVGLSQQATINVDSAQALVAACLQLFASGARQLELVALRPFQLSGIFFSHHPGRPDVALSVMEGASRHDEKSRLFVDHQGTVRWCFPEQTPLAAIPATQILQLQQFLHAQADVPLAAEWTWDGEQLAIVQWFPILSLSMPQEAWSCRTLLGFSPQVMTPLWYTCWARWMKAGFWRMQQSPGFAALEKSEPYRRLNSHLYFNSAFASAMSAAGHSVLDEALPVGWKNNTDKKPETHGTLASRVRLSVWAWQMKRRAAEQDPWRRLMKLDALGYRLARLSLSDLLTTNAHQIRRLSRSEKRLLDGLPSLLSPLGLDPVWSSSSPERNASLMPATWLGPVADNLNDARAWFSQVFADSLMLISRQLVSRGQLVRAEDIYFCFFDELWELWFNPEKRLPDAKLQDRKLRYMADAHAGPPDWLIDGKAYGATPFFDQQSQPLLRGDCLAPGEASGPIRKIFSAWQLNLIEQGDIVVLHHAESGWLPVLGRAAGFILAHRQPLDPVAAFAHQYGVPSIWNVTDALHSLVDGAQVTLQAAQGTVLFHQPIVRETD